MLNGPLTSPGASGSIPAMPRKSSRTDVGPPYLREWREERDLTIEAAARLAGANDKSWLYKRELRKVPITSEDMDALARVYRIKPSQFYDNPNANVNDRLASKGYPFSSDADLAALKEGRKMPVDHNELALLCLNLPEEAIPTVSLFIRNLLKTTKEQPDHPSKGKAGA